MTRWVAAAGLAAVVALAASTAHAQDAAQPEPPAQPSSTAAVAPAPAPAPVYIPEEQPSAFGPRYRSPGLAAALSLTPVPVDFGNLYAENVGWGLVYTTAELGLAGGMMWLGADHMCHRTEGCGDWSGGEIAGMAALVTGYVAVKVVAGVHAASAAREFNERARPAVYPALAPIHSGATLSLAASF